MFQMIETPLSESLPEAGADARRNGIELRLPSGEPMPHAQVVFHEGFFSAEESRSLFTELRENIRWRQDHLRFGGKQVALPRLTAWHGDENRDYAYSGIRMRPEPWTPALSRIKAAVEAASQATYNSVLLNFYRDGKDSVSWHSDDEKEFGVNPTIASVTFGGARRFVLRYERDRTQQVELKLTDGSLLIMASETQHFWQHQVPKTQKKVEPRINLTFRLIR